MDPHLNRGVKYMWQHNQIAGRATSLVQPNPFGKPTGGLGNDRGYGKIAQDMSLIRSQAPKGSDSYGEGSTTRWLWGEPLVPSKV